MLPEVRRRARSTAASRRRSDAGGVPDRRHRRRSAGGAVRSDVPVAGPDEEHLRHRLLPAAEHRRAAGRLAQPAAHDRRLAGRRARRTYALEGSVFIGGAVVQWLRDGLGIIAKSSDVEALAASVPDSGGVYLVPAFAGLGAPHWDPYARGTIVGITRGTTAGAHRAGGPREHRVSGRRPARRDARRLPASSWPSCASTAARPPTTC